MNKRKVLWVSEASFLNTGFSVQSKAILDYLYKTGKYEIIELGSYAKTSDPRADQVPWRFYGAIPEGNDPIENKRYETYEGQFGAAVFENVLLETTPDVVIDIRDPFFMDWQLKSPYRKYFNLIWQPTVDSEPQQRIWLDNFKRADLILTLSRYGKEVLQKESDVKIFDIARPGADHNAFQPKDRTEARKILGIGPDANILLNVARNQKRKLFPDLLLVFKQLLEKFAINGQEDLYKNTYLYLHTSYPDVGFDISKFLIHYGLSSKVLFTYACKNCNHVWSDFWQTEVTTCQRCKQNSAFLPNTSVGVTTEHMNNIYNAANAFISYSICEGLCCPAVEAKMCGLPLFAVEYSATVEQTECPGCYPIKVARYFHESIVETQQMRCYPDNDDAVKKLYDWFSQPKEKWTMFKDIIRKDAIDGYSFERSAKIFEKAIDSLPQKNRNLTWFNPEPRLLPLSIGIPNDVRTNADFVEYYIDRMWNKPELKNSELRNQWVRGLNVGYIMMGQARDQFTPKEFHNMMVNMAAEHNYWENKRVAVLCPTEDSYINWENA